MLIRSGYYDGTGVAMDINFGVDLSSGKYLIGLKGNVTSRPGVIKTGSMPADGVKQMISPLGIQTGVITAGLSSGFSVGTDVRANAAGERYRYFVIKDDGAGDFDEFTYVGNSNGTTNDNRDILGSLGGQEPDLVGVASSASNRIPLLRFRATAGDSSHLFDGGSTANWIQATLVNGFQVGTSDYVNANGVTFYAFMIRAADNLVAFLRWTGDGVNNRDLAGAPFTPDNVFAKSEAIAYSGVFHFKDLAATDSSHFPGNAAPATGAIKQFVANGMRLGTHTSVNNNGTVYNALLLRDTVTARQVPLTAALGQTLTRTVLLTTALSATVRSVPLLAALKVTSERSVPLTAALFGYTRQVPLTTVLDAAPINPVRMVLTRTFENIGVRIDFAGDSDANAGIGWRTVTSDGALAGATSITLNAATPLPISLIAGSRIRWWNGVDSVLSADADLGDTILSVQALPDAVPSGVEAWITDLQYRPTAPPEVAQTEWDFGLPLHRASKRTDRWLISDICRQTEGSTVEVRASIYDGTNDVITVMTGSTVLRHSDEIPDASLMTPTKYVDSLNGNNAWNGQSRTFQGGTTGPWKTLEWARTHVENGDIVELYGYHQAFGASKFIDAAGVKIIARHPACGAQDAATLDIPMLNAGQRTVIHGTTSMAPSGQPSVDPHGVYMGAGLWKRCNGVGGNPPAIVGTDGVTYTDIWVWQGAKPLGVTLGEIYYSTTRDGKANRVGAWWQDGSDNSASVPNLSTISGWADMVHNNDTYRYGAFSLRTSGDVYLRFAEGTDPNGYWWDLAVNGYMGIGLRNADQRVSGVMFRGTSGFGVQIGHTATSPRPSSEILRPVVDRCYFSGPQIGVWFLGVGAFSTGSLNGRESNVAKDAVIQDCMFEDSNMRLTADEGYVQHARHLPWWIIKGPPRYNGVDYALPSGSKQRAMGFAETVAFQGKGGGWSGLVFRRCQVKGYQNAAVSPVGERDIWPFSAGDTDVHRVKITDANDDPFEPEQAHSNWRVYDCWIEDCAKVVSFAPVSWGTFRFWNISARNIGNHGAPLNYDQVADNRFPGAQQFFKESGHGDSPVGEPAIRNAPEITVANVSFYTDKDASGPGKGFGQPADVLEFSTGSGLPGNIWKIFNSIMLAHRYAWHVGSDDWYLYGTWDIDATVLATSDAIRGVGFNSGTITGGNGFNTAPALRTKLESSPNRTTLRNGKWFNSVRTAGGGRVDLSVIDREPVKALFQDLQTLQLAPGGGAVDAGILIPTIMDRKGVHYFGQAPDLGAFQTETETTRVRQVPLDGAFSLTDVARQIPLTASFSVLTTRLIPLTTAFRVSPSRSVPLTAAVTESGVRRIPLTAAIGDLPQRRANVIVLGRRGTAFDIT